MEDDQVPRRRVLALTGAGIGSLAGCLSSSDPDGDASPTESPKSVEPTETPAQATPTATETPQPGTRIQSFVGVDGTDLVTDGGPVHLFGTRPQNMMDLSHPVEWIEENLDLMAREGYTLARVHAFQPFWGDESKQPDPGKTTEAVMQRLDRVVEAARVRGIRLSLMLLNGKPPLHNADSLDDNPGVNAHTYANYAESADSYDEFYTNDECKALYKERVETVLTRENTITGVEHRNEPAIAMWELGNEIEYAEPWTHDDPTLRPWIEEMGDFVTSIDENHLVTTGEFGWAGRNNYTADHEPESVDLCSIHYYPGPQSYDLRNDDERDHPGLLRDLIETGQQELGKPVYVGEYNWQVETGAEPPLTERNEQLRVIHDTLEDVDVAAAAYHSMAQSDQQDWPRGGATTFGDTDDGSMAEFKRFASIQYAKSADGTLPVADAFD